MTIDEEYHLKAVEDNLKQVQAENSLLRGMVDEKHKDNVKLWELINRLAETNQKLSVILSDREFYK